tara:strand:- start:700 stop:1035 length:336 start_codon:yes stop_codon:yes gene_type:complete
MSRLELILMGTLFLSLVFNGIVFLYARSAITQLLSVSEELGDLKDMVDSFAQHLQQVYELETFYGDETLRRLLDHAISFNKQLETFEYIYSLTEEEGNYINDEQEAEEAQE